MSFAELDMEDVFCCCFYYYQTNRTTIIKDPHLNFFDNPLQVELTF